MLQHSLVYHVNFVRGVILSYLWRCLRKLWLVREKFSEAHTFTPPPPLFWPHCAPAAGRGWNYALQSIDLISRNWEERSYPSSHLLTREGGGIISRERTRRRYWSCGPAYAFITLYFEGESTTAMNGLVDTQRYRYLKDGLLYFKYCVEGSIIQGEEIKTRGCWNYPHSSLFAKGEPPNIPLINISSGGYLGNIWRSYCCWDLNYPKAMRHIYIYTSLQFLPFLSVFSWSSMVDEIGRASTIEEWHLQW